MTTINEKKIRKIVREEISEVTKEGLKIGTHSIYITPNSINMDGNLIGKVGSVIFGNSGVQDASITRAGPYSLQVANDLAVSGVVSSNTVNTNFMHSTSMQVDGSLGISTLYVENMNVNNILSVRTSGFTTNIYSYDEGTIFINNTILSSGYYTGTGNIKTTFGTLIVGSDTLGTTIATNLIKLTDVSIYRTGEGSIEIDGTIGTLHIGNHSLYNTSGTLVSGATISAPSFVALGNIKTIMGVLTAGTGTTINSNSIAMSDVNWYRMAEDTIGTDDNMHVIGNLLVDGTITASGTMAVGTVALSAVSINTNKDWLTYSITNMGTLTANSVNATLSINNVTIDNNKNWNNWAITNLNSLNVQTIGIYDGNKDLILYSSGLGSIRTNVDRLVVDGGVNIGNSLIVNTINLGGNALYNNGSGTLISGATIASPGLLVAMGNIGITLGNFITGSTTINNVSGITSSTANIANFVSASATISTLNVGTITGYNPSLNLSGLSIDVDKDWNGKSIYNANTLGIGTLYVNGLSLYNNNGTLTSGSIITSPGFTTPFGAITTGTGTITGAAVRASSVLNANSISAYSGTTISFTALRGNTIYATTYENLALGSLSGSLTVSQHGSIATGDPHTQYVLIAGDTMNGDLGVNGSITCSTIKIGTNSLYNTAGTLISGATMATPGLVVAMGNVSIAQGNFITGATTINNTTGISAFTINSTSVVGNTITGTTWVGLPAGSTMSIIASGSTLTGSVTIGVGTYNTIGVSGNSITIGSTIPIINLSTGVSINADKDWNLKSLYNVNTIGVGTLYVSGLSLYNSSGTLTSGSIISSTGFITPFGPITTGTGTISGAVVKATTLLNANTINAYSGTSINFTALRGNTIYATTYENLPAGATGTSIATTSGTITGMVTISVGNYSTLGLSGNNITIGSTIPPLSSLGNSITLAQHGSIATGDPHAQYALVNGDTFSGLVAFSTITNHSGHIQFQDTSKTISWADAYVYRYGTATIGISNNLYVPTKIISPSATISNINAVTISASSIIASYGSFTTLVGAGGAGSISALTIDADKNWNAKGIYNMSSISLNTVICSNVIMMGDGYAPPAEAANSAGSKLNLYSGDYNYQIGLQTNAMWFKAPYFQWYANTASVLSLDSNGILQTWICSAGSHYRLGTFTALSRWSTLAVSVGQGDNGYFYDNGYVYLGKSDESCAVVVRGEVQVSRAISVSDGRALGNWAFYVRQSSDAAWRFLITNAGKLHWDDGTAGVYDVDLYRYGPNTLGTDNNFISGATITSSGVNVNGVVRFGAGYGAPVVSNDSAGSKLNLYSGDFDNQIGLESGGIWFKAGVQFRWYNASCGTLLTLNNAGLLTALNVDVTPVSSEGEQVCLRFKNAYGVNTGYKYLTWDDASASVGAISVGYNGTYTSMYVSRLYNGGYNSNTVVAIHGNGLVSVPGSITTGAMNVTGTLTTSVFNPTNISCTNLTCSTLTIGNAAFYGNTDTITVASILYSEGFQALDGNISTAFGGISTGTGTISGAMVKAGNSTMTTSGITTPSVTTSDLVGSFLQRGSNSTNADGMGTITFGTAYASAPVVVATPVSSSSVLSLMITSVSTTQFIVKIHAVAGINTGAGSSHSHGIPLTQTSDVNCAGTTHHHALYGSTDNESSHTHAQPSSGVEASFNWIAIKA